MEFKPGNQPLRLPDLSSELGVEHRGFEPRTPCLPEMWYALHLVLQRYPARCTVGFPFRRDTHIWLAVARNSGQFSGQTGLLTLLCAPRVTQPNPASVGIPS